MRPRDNQQKKFVARVDEFANILAKDYPEPSEAHKKYYENIWKPEDFGLEPIGGQGVASGAKQPAFEAGPSSVEVPFVGAPKVNDKNFSDALTLIEKRLAKQGEQYIGGKQPTYEDREAI